MFYPVEEVGFDHCIMNHILEDDPVTGVKFLIE